jgi:2-oxo-3-hexenedioate decarboxylase
MGLNSRELAAEFMEVRARGGFLTPPTARDDGFDLEQGYAVGAELVRLRRESGRKTVGRKIGFTNKTIWPALGLGTVIWAQVYDNTLQYAAGNSATLSLAGTTSACIEPEIVFKLRSSPPVNAGAEEILKAVEWLALGFEIVDCNFPEWKFRPADAIADFGLHAALIVGEPQPVGDILQLAQQLRDFKVRLLKEGQVVAEGVGQNVLDSSPAFALGWLAETMQQQGAEPLAAGEVVTTGTLTVALEVKPGESWSAEVDGINLPSLELKFT